MSSFFKASAPHPHIRGGRSSSLTPGTASHDAERPFPGRLKTAGSDVLHRWVIFVGPLCPLFSFFKFSSPLRAENDHVEVWIQSFWWRSFPLPLQSGRWKPNKRINSGKQSTAKSFWVCWLPINWVLFILLQPFQCKDSILLCLNFRRLYFHGELWAAVIRFPPTPTLLQGPQQISFCSHSGCMEEGEEGVHSVICPPKFI